uniref:Uncharacterized protein n=1 Tax=uncultured Planctomycetota bacterium TaxID=120965 RepID=H5S873_9BACT|nr:hypothetical protein HGMM_F01A04C06 [uncultured Planctomycetota bacterium]
MLTNLLQDIVHYLARCLLCLLGIRFADIGVIIARLRHSLRTFRFFQFANQLRVKLHLFFLQRLIIGGKENLEQPFHRRFYITAFIYDVLNFP